MQIIEQYKGIFYISRMTWDERVELCSLIKSIKTYDYAYFIPNDVCTTVIAIKAKSIVATFTIPIVLPGLLCIYLGSFMNFTGFIDPKDIDPLTGKPRKGAMVYYPDIIFPTLDECLGRYMYIVLSEEQYEFTEALECIYTPAYHMIPKIESAYNEINRYISCSQMSVYSESATEQFLALFRSLRADDGSKFLAIDPKHIISVYAGMIPVNKADGLDIVLYDNPIDNKFLMKFVIKKKKQDPIEVYGFFLRV